MSLGNDWRAALRAWAERDGVTWIYLFKLLTATFLTYWLALRLELPQPTTALATVFIVMQPQSGQVIAKSAWRLLGTLLGAVVVVTLIALFGQHSDLFLGCLALWVGLCCGLSARYRNFQAYAFVLTGYTAAIVGVPALSHPEGVYLSAVWRAIEIGLAVICSGVVSAVIFPQNSRTALRATIGKRLGLFAAFAADSLQGRLAEGAFAQHNRRLVAEAVGLEHLRSVTVFEDPLTHMRSGRLSRLNSEFMQCTTRFNALHQQLQRLRHEAPGAWEDLQPALAGLVALLEDYRNQPLDSAGAAPLAERLQRLHADTAVRLRHLPATACQQDLDTAGELLLGLIDELHDYAQTHASLASHRHPRERWAAGYTPRTNLWLCAASGVRGFLTVALAASFWLATAWPSGISLMISAAAGISLTASTPNPWRAGVQMGLGVVLSSLFGFIEYFLLYPHIDGFPLLCFVLAPALLFGGFLTTRMSTMGIGLGFLITFATGAIPANLTVYNPSGFLNDCIANIIAFGLCAIAGAVILPSNAPWAWRHLQRDLRRQVGFAAHGSLKHLRQRFDSRSRDVLQHATSLSAARPAVQDELLQWALSVQDVGHALVRLRELGQAPAAVSTALARLFDRPGAAQREQALLALDEALAAQPAQPQAAYLHFIRSALLNPRSPLASA
ncbi:FUSC family protein [Pseudomonas sp. App30]|uniref:FUSC family protein n=1 Tax=Pseudomonas sp. App30 TaxID=3068990 RepID=UPI003A7FF4CB